MFSKRLLARSPALPQNFADPAHAVCLKTNPTEGNDDERVQQASRHDLARALAPRYAHASRRENGQLLNEFCAITVTPASMRWSC